MCAAVAVAADDGTWEPAPSGIPALFHQIWFDFGTGDGATPPARYDAIRATWRDHHPTAKHFLWTWPRAQRFVKQHYPDLHPAFVAYKRPVQQTDVFRLLVLDKLGGVYVDMDCKCLASWQPKILQTPRVQLVVVYNERARVHSNWCMACVPGHPFIRRCVSIIARQPWWHRLCNCKYSTLGTLCLAGPYFVHAVLHQSGAVKRSDTVRLPMGAPYVKHFGEGTWWLSYSANNACDVLRVVLILAAVIVLATVLVRRCRSGARVGNV